MASWQDGVGEELDWLRPRLERLDRFVRRAAFVELSRRQQNLLKLQQIAMADYVQILQERLLEDDGGPLGETARVPE